jgi:hypothetical protein
MDDDFELFESILKKANTKPREHSGVSECAHKVLVDGTCVACHEHLQDSTNFSDGCVQRRLGQFPDLVNRGFSDEVVSTAQSYFRETQSCSPAFRGKMRTAVIAASVYHALLKAGTHASFSSVARMFGVENRAASRGFQKVKMAVVETRNQFETPAGVAAWIVEKFVDAQSLRARIVALVAQKYADAPRLCPASLRAHVAASVLMLLDDESVSTSAVAERVDASCKKVSAHLCAFRRS